MYRKNLDAAFLAAASTPGEANPLVTATEQMWTQNANTVELKPGFGDSGVKVGTEAVEVAKAVDSMGDDSYTKYLLHMDDDSLTDSKGNAVTIVGSAAKSTAQSVFGGASLNIPAEGGYLSMPNSNDIKFGTGDFTIDYRVRFTAINANNITIDAGSYETGVRINTQGGATAVSMANTAYNLTWAPATNTWYHFALVRYGNILRGYVNGTQIGTDQNVTGKNITTTEILTIGDRVTSGVPMTGYIDEVRISKGIARWTAPFTPPAYAYAEGGAVSQNLVTTGTMSFSPATIGFTSDGVALQAPADLTAMDAAATIDYSFNAAGGDGTTGYTGAPITPTAFAALAASTFAGKTALFLKLIPVAAQVITAVKMDTQAASMLTMKSGAMTMNINGVDVIELQDDGDGVFADITADDIYLTGAVDQDEDEAAVKSQTKSDNYTMTDADSGVTTYVDTDAKTITLPATAVNRTFTLMNAGADGAVALTIRPNSSDKIMGGLITPEDDKDIVNTKATAKKGDFVTLVGDGVDGWFIVKMKGIWAREA